MSAVYDSCPSGGHHSWLQFAAPRMWSGSRLLNPHRTLGLKCLKCGEKREVQAIDPAVVPS